MPWNKSKLVSVKGLKDGRNCDCILRKLVFFFFFFSRLLWKSTTALLKLRNYQTIKLSLQYNRLLNLNCPSEIFLGIRTTGMSKYLWNSHLPFARKTHHKRNTRKTNDKLKIKTRSCNWLTQVKTRQ